MQIKEFLWVICFFVLSFGLYLDYFLPSGPILWEAYYFLSYIVRILWTAFGIWFFWLVYFITWIIGIISGTSLSFRDTWWKNAYFLGLLLPTSYCHSISTGEERWILLIAYFIQDFVSIIWIIIFFHHIFL